MKVTVLGRSLQRKEGVGKKSGKSYAGYFVTLGYENPEVIGYSTKDMLYTDDIMRANNGYLPKPGDKCECTVGFNGFIESLEPIVDESKK